MTRPSGIYPSSLADAERTLTAIAPEALPPGTALAVSAPTARWYRVRLQGQPLTVVLTVDYWDGQLWAQLTVTGRLSEPSAAELRWCKDVFLGERTAVQVFPPKSEPHSPGERFALHLYAPLQVDPLPNFRRCERRGA